MKTPIQIATQALAIIATFGYDDIYHGIERVQQIASNALDEIAEAPILGDDITTETRLRLNATQEALRTRATRVKNLEATAFRKYADLQMENRQLKASIRLLERRQAIMQQQAKQHQ